MHIRQEKNKELIEFLIKEIKENYKNIEVNKKDENIETTVEENQNNSRRNLKFVIIGDSIVKCMNSHLIGKCEQDEAKTISITGCKMERCLNLIINSQYNILLSYFIYHFHT